MEGAKLGQQELERQLENFRNIAEQRQAAKMVRWMYHFPLIISIAVFISQLFNVGILFSYSRDFNRLFDLLVEYMNRTEVVSTVNADSNPYHIEGINSERLEIVDKYHERLWSLFVSEVIELLIPLFNMFVFGWIFFTKGGLHARIKIIYIMAPALALLLSVSQACMIQISLADRIHHVRFILGKIISPLLEHNPNGSRFIENTFDCQFWDNDENGGRNSTPPSCSSVLHDEVVSSTTLDVIIFLHVVPIVVFIYVLLRNLAQGDAEHLFLYVENLEHRIGEESSPSVSSLTTTVDGVASSQCEKNNGMPRPSSMDELKIVVANLLKGCGDHSPSDTEPPNEIHNVNGEKSSDV
uniref:ABC transmembrane type-1 domain-containing protein n=2 Tax=Parascaris univalens TaxID=6257 RepID=A0A915CAG9_PARUN